MKRILALLLALCLLCPTALADTPDVLPEVSARYLFILHDAIHALTYDGMMYRRGDDGWLPAGALYDDVWALDSDGKTVWLIARREESDEAGYDLCRAVFDGQGALTASETVCRIDWNVRAESWPQFYGLVVDGDTAYVAVSGEDWSSRDLYRVPLESGKASLILTDNLTAIVRYKDGLLLAQRPSSQRENGDSRAEVLIIDPVEGRSELVCSMTDAFDGGLTYDPETDAAYFSNASYVYRISGDVPERIGYLVMSGVDTDRPLAVVHQGRYYVHTYRGLTSAALDPALLPKRTLRLHQETVLIESLVIAFARQHPDIAIEYVNDYYHGLENFVRVMQGENAPDVILPDLDQDFITLRDRKYLIDLSSSDILMDTVSRMAPNITRDVLVDGKLYALPYALYVSMNSYYPRALEKAGLTPEDVPASYEGLLAFIERWHDDYWEDNEGMQLFEYCYNLRTFLFQQIYDAQLRSCQEDGRLTLDTPTFRRLLARLEELVPVINEVSPPLTDDDFDYEFMDNALFSDMIDVVIRDFPIDEMYASRPMPLALDEASDPTIDGFLYLVALNPYSQNKETAIEFMEFVAENLAAREKVALMPDEVGPLERFNYEGELQDMRDRLARQEALLEGAPEERRADLEDEIAYLRNQIKDYEQNRWAMTPEEIQWYKENIAPYLVFTTSSIYSENTAEQLRSLKQRYLDGQASLEEFIQRHDEIVWMHEQEK